MKRNFELIKLSDDLVVLSRKIRLQAFEVPENAVDEKVLIEALDEEVSAMFDDADFTMPEQMMKHNIKVCKCPNCQNSNMVLTFKYKNIYGETCRHNDIFGFMGFISRDDMTDDCLSYFEDHKWSKIDDNSAEMKEV